MKEITEMLANDVILLSIRKLKMCAMLFLFVYGTLINDVDGLLGLMVNTRSIKIVSGRCLEPPRRQGLLSEP
jgi:hypothetical protein